MFIQSLSTFILSLAALKFVVAQDTSLAAVMKAFTAANIPTDISLLFNPSLLLEVTFPQTSSAPITLHAGIQLPRNVTAGPPIFRAIGPLIRPSHKFVVATIDPDAPTPQAPTSAQIRHFLGGDFTLVNRVGLLRNSTPAITEFHQPTPPAGSDPHRYVFLLFNQPPGFDKQTFITPTTPISMFNLSAFAGEVGLGNPVAGTFMLVGPEPST